MASDEPRDQSPQASASRDATIGERVPSGLSLVSRLSIGIGLLVMSMAGLVVWAMWLDAPILATACMMLGAGALSAVWVIAWIVMPFRRATTALQLGIETFRDGDFGFRLAPPAQGELAELVRLFNQLGLQMSDQHRVVYQKELLLDAIVQNAPMAILLIGPTHRIILANQVARQMFRLERPLIGSRLAELIRAAPDALAKALQRGSDTLLTCFDGADRDVYHISFGFHQFDGQHHQLIMVKRLTREIRRQEVDTWKKVIRMVNHELNNALAPLSSLIHSARTILTKPEMADKLTEPLDAMERITQGMVRFVQDYAAFARLPTPRKQRVEWAQFLAQLRDVMQFRYDIEACECSVFDPDQMRQALINLLKNAWDASPNGDPPFLRVTQNDQRDTILELIDWGTGMSSEAMEKALLPFFSTKKTGTGLGLPLCREIMEAHGGGIRLQEAPSGGVKVICWLPNS